MIPNFDRLRLMNMYGGSDDGSDDGSMDFSNPYGGPYIPADPNSPNVNYGGLAPGQEPQNPDTAASFGQSLPGNIFDPATSSTRQPGKPPTTDDEWTKMYRDMYHPSSVAQDRLNKLLDNFPQEEAPSFARKFAASLAGVGKGGLKDAQFILDEPNRSALERFKAQADPFEKAADNERQANVNERTLVQQSIAAKQNQAKIDETARKDRETAASKATRDGAYAFAKEHPNWIVDFKSGPNIIAYNPQDPTKKLNLGPSGHLDDRTKLEIEDATKTKVANITAGGAGARSGVFAQWKDPDGTEHSGYVNPVTNTGTPAKTPSGQELGAATKVGGPGKGQPANLADIQNRANETLGAINELIDDKDQLRPEIKNVIGYHRYNPLVALDAPGTDYVAANRSIKRVQSTLILDLIGELKTQSRTGATGFGQLSGPELAILVSAASKLDPAMKDADFQREVVRIRDYVKKITLPPNGLNPTVIPKRTKTPQDYWDELNRKD